MKEKRGNVCCLRGNIISILFLTLLFFSCFQKKEKIPEGIITEEKMIRVLVDLHIAEAKLQTNAPLDNSLSIKKSYYKSISDKHKISFEQLIKSIKYYSMRPQLFSEIYDGVIIELSKVQAKVSEN